MVTSLRDAWGSALTELAARDERIVLLDADLANSTKADVFAGAHPDRFLEMGIAEQNMVGVAAGMSFHGHIPWLSSFAVFFTHRAVDQIRMLVAQTGANVKIAAAYAGVLTGATGKTHQDVQDLAIMRAMPGMTVLCPADPHELTAMMPWINAHQGPVYLRLARDPAASVSSPDCDFTPGAVRVLSDGADAALVSTGVQSSRVLEAAGLLAELGHQVRVIHLPSIKPLDDDALATALAGVDQIVTIEEHSIYAGVGGLVAETMATHGLPARLHTIGLRDVWGESASNDDLLDLYGLSPQRITATVAGLLSDHNQEQGAA